MEFAEQSSEGATRTSPVSAPRCRVTGSVSRARTRRRAVENHATSTRHSARRHAYVGIMAPDRGRRPGGQPRSLGSGRGSRAPQARSQAAALLRRSLGFSRPRGGSAAAKRKAMTWPAGSRRDNVCPFLNVSVQTVKRATMLRRPEHGHMKNQVTNSIESLLSRVTSHAMRA